jgi:3-methyladenine DNA glycosylase/8-oxoguanine DNA glycosylase
MMQALFENYGVKLVFGGKELYGFWEPKYLVKKSSEEKLRSLKFGYRAKSIYKISQQFSNKQVNEFDLRKTDIKKQEESLLSLYGVGPASTDYMMEGIFHRFNYMNKISPWEQKIYTKLFWNKNYDKRLVPTDKMLIYFKKHFGEWRRLAVHYIWEDLWWQRKHKNIPWLEKLIRT